MNIAKAASSIWALVPSKELLRAKTRLAGVLTPAERRLLVLAMVEDVLETLCNAPQLAGVAVISRDPSVRALAERLGAVLLDDSGNDLNESLQVGAAQLVARGATGLLVIPADVPLVASEDVAALAEALRSGAQLALAPARADGGTNGMALSLPSPLVFQFGHNSFALHHDAGAQQGLPLVVYHSATLGLDIDTVDDLCLLEGVAGAPATQSVLRAIAFQPCCV